MALRRRPNACESVGRLKSSTIPVLLIHGEADINILPRHSRILARANPAHIQLWLVPGARHGGAASVAPQEFWFRVLNFLAQHDSLSPGVVRLRNWIAFGIFPGLLWYF